MKIKELFSDYGPAVISSVAIATVLILLAVAASSEQSYKILSIDGCEYIQCIRDQSLVHKANCPNHE